MGRFIELIPYSEAVARIQSTLWKPLGTEYIESGTASGRIVSSRVEAKEDVPGWNRSLVDGYAVRSRDCSMASETNPVKFSLNGTIEAGSSTYTEFLEQHCTEIYTGGILPSDYDAVVMAEDADISGDKISIFKPVKLWENIEKKGDDIRAKSILISRAERVRPWHISALLSSGVNRIEVYKKLKVGIISTGNELFEGTQGFIPNTTQRIYTNYLNRPFLSAQDAGMSHDKVDEIRDLVKRALGEYDCVIVTGGTSLGGKDEVPEAMDGVGNVIFAGSMLRPGRTLTLYEVEGKPVFSVSGIPVPSLLSFDVYFEEYLKKVTGIEEYRQCVTGKLKSPLTNRAGYTTVFRVKYTATQENGAVEIVKTKGTGSLGSILNSTGTLLVPDNVEGYPAESAVVVKLFGDVI